MNNKNYNTMNKLLILTAAFLAGSLVNSHAQTFLFGYDGSGNRTYRIYDAPDKAPAFEIVEIKAQFNPSGETIENREAIPENGEAMDALLKEGKILVYPNPNGGVFNIYLPLQNGASAQITLFDYAGRQVYHTTTDQPQNSVDISQWPNGTYIVKIALEGQVVMHRVVKR
jgi:hypothetical protein